MTYTFVEYIKHNYDQKRVQIIIPLLSMNKGQKRTNNTKIKCLFRNNSLDIVVTSTQRFSQISATAICPLDIADTNIYFYTKAKRTGSCSILDAKIVMRKKTN